MKMSPNKIQKPATQTAGKLQKQRKGLLAVVHIARKNLGLDDDLYRDILGRWGVASAAAMSIPELEALVNYFAACGFRVVSKKKKPGHSGHAEALRCRIRQEADGLKNGDLRLAGLVKSKAGVEKLEWCRDVSKLKQILRVLCVFKERDAEEQAEDIYD
jgi:phage gp16-like protein